MTKYVSLKKAVSAVVLTTMVLSPAFAVAANTVDFESLTIEQKIVHLYGQIAQLQILLDLMEAAEENGSNNGRVLGVSSSYGEIVVSGSNSSSRYSISDDVEVYTIGAYDVREDEADLRGRVDLEDERYATVWFEYGEDRYDLDERSAKKRIYDSNGETQNFTINIDDLDEDEKYYYRAVVEDNDDDREYGVIKSFSTEEEGHTNRSGGFELTVSDTRIDEGDRIEVEWEIPNDEEGSNNWIGLYEVGDSDREYISWSYLDNDDTGTEYFRIYDEGEYEFRLFLDNSYNEEITSDEIEVED